MKTYIKTVVLLMTVVLGLASCSNDVLKGSNEPVKADTDGLRVRFSLESDAKARTRADYSGTLIAGFDREKAIDANQSYAVVYKGDGTTFYKAFKLSYNNEDAQNPYYYFKVENGGYYYMYVVANCSLDLTAAAQTTTLSAGGPSALFGLVETTDPGTNKQASTNFLMISGKTLVDVDGNEDTDLGSVALTRAAVRFDIDVTAITGFQITSVDVTKRATHTKLARTGSDTSMDGLDIAAGTETYTVGTGSGQVLDNHETYVEGTDGYYVSPSQWIGVIYGYENLNAAAADAMTVTVHGMLLGRTVEHTVNFGELTTPVQPKRNTIYTIKLTADGSGVGVGDIHSDIVVKDWAEGATIIYTGLKDDTTPSFQLTSGQKAKDYTAPDADAATKTNPGTIVTDGEANTVIQLEVTGSKVGSRLTCTGRYDYSEGTTVQVSNSEVTCTAGAVTTNDAGNIVQTWTITMFSALEEDDYLTFSLMNEYEQVNAKRTFKVTCWKDAHIGDFYYSDGTWSTEKDNSKTVIGLVFCTTPTSDDQARGYKHGYVIALKDYADANDTKWAEATADVNGIMDDYSITQANQFGGAATNSTLSEPASIDLNGLTNTLKIAAKASGKTYGSDATLKLSDITDTKYHAAYKAVNFAASSNGVAAPAKSSGWYLPSIGQQYLWLYYFGRTTRVPYRFSDNKDCQWMNGSAQVAGTAMNTYFTNKVGAGNFTQWDQSKSGKYYWSSTVRSASGYPFALRFDTAGYLRLYSGTDATDASRVRPVLAF